MRHGAGCSSLMLWDHLEGGVGWEVRNRFKRKGTCVYLWLILVDV